MSCSCDSEFWQNGMDPPAEDSELPARPSTPQPFRRNIKVYCEVSFLHKIGNASLAVGGRVDIGVAIALPSIATNSFPSNSPKKPNRRFHSLLFCAEAKVKDNPRSGVPQLIVYLGSLRQSRINRGKSDCSVYGVATDGFIYIFVTISHEGVMQMTKPFHVLYNELPTILGHLTY